MANNEHSGAAVITTHGRILWWAFAAALAVGAAGYANAAEPRGAVPQLAGIATDLGHNTSALTYWLDEAGGAQFVTTIDTVTGSGVASSEDLHAVVRFSALILAGQSQTISVPGPAGSPPQVLRIRNLGTRFDTADIEIDRVFQSAPATN